MYVCSTAGRGKVDLLLSSNVQTWSTYPRSAVRSSCMVLGGRFFAKKKKNSKLFLFLPFFVPSFFSRREFFFFSYFFVVVVLVLRKKKNVFFFSRKYFLPPHRPPSKEEGHILLLFLHQLRGRLVVFSSSSTPCPPLNPHVNSCPLFRPSILTHTHTHIYELAN